MRALVLQEFGTIGVEDVSDPVAPVADEVRIRISYTGICGSDIHGFTGENGRRVAGQVMGHETVGHIDALGPQADSELAQGQRVTFNPLVSCGSCEACSAGQEQHCPHRVVFGVAPELVAAFAEFVTIPSRNVVPLSDAGDERHGALIEPLAVALHAVRRAGVKRGDTVLVTGSGPIGQSAVLAAIRLGASAVLATDISAQRRELCEKLGAASLDPTTAPTEVQVRATLGRPVDVAIDAAGVSATLTAALLSTRLGGTVALVGMGSPELVLPAYKLSTEERTVVGSFCYNAQTFRDAAAWVAEGHEVFDTLISATVPMSEANATFDKLAHSADTPGKVLVSMKEV